MTNQKHKKAFSMITAIFVIVMMATIASLIQNITGKTIKATTQQYQKEQAVLLARSYTELAILYVTGYDRNSSNGCLNRITGAFGDTNNRYNVEIKIKYIGKDSELTFCDASEKTPLLGINSFSNTISLIIDIYVKYKNFDDPSGKNITYHRRTLQKI